MDYIDTVEIAKMIRKELKEKVPGIKFSVRSDKYSGGSSIDVSWPDGPTEKEIEKIVGKYNGSGFDGMIDLKYNNNHWQLPNREIVLAGTQGTEGSMGSMPSWETEKPHPDAKPVRLSVDYIFCNRKVNTDIYNNVIMDLAERYGIKTEGRTAEGLFYERPQNSSQDLSMMAHRVLGVLDLTNGYTGFTIDHLNGGL